MKSGDLRQFKFDTQKAEGSYYAKNAKINNLFFFVVEDSAEIESSLGMMTCFILLNSKVQRANKNFILLNSFDITEMKEDDK